MLRARPLPLRAIGAAIAMFAVVAPAARANAAPTTACTARSGVTVIVDFTHFGRNIERGCAPGHPATALAALRAAGFQTAGTAQYGDAFLCRVNGLPSTKHEPCTNTPPANSSWSFYWARRADTDWTYSAAGVLSYRPPAGTMMAFAFGNYAKPGIEPTAVFGPTTTTTVAAAAVTAPNTAPATAVASVPTAPPSTTVATATAAASTSTSSSASARPSASTTSAVPPIVNETIANTHDSSGSPLPALLALALVAILAGGGWMAMRARRRRAT